MDCSPFSNLKYADAVCVAVGYIYAWNLKSNCRWITAIFYQEKAFCKKNLSNLALSNWFDPCYIYHQYQGLLITAHLRMNQCAHEVWTKEK